MSGSEREKARHRTEMYLIYLAKNSLIGSFFAYDSSLHTLQAPLQDPSGTKLRPGDPAPSAHALAAAGRAGRP